MLWNHWQQQGIPNQQRWFLDFSTLKRHGSRFSAMDVWSAHLSKPASRVERMPPLLDLEHQDCNKCGNDFVRGTRLDQISKLVSSSMYLGRCELLVSCVFFDGSWTRKWFLRWEKFLPAERVSTRQFSLKCSERAGHTHDAPTFVSTQQT